MLERAISAAAAFCIFLSGCASIAPEPPAESLATPVMADARFSPLRNEFKSMVDSGELVSLAIGVMEDGDVVWAEAFGWSDREAQAAATLSTRYGLASLGKSVTATAAMTLVENRKLSLDANVTDYVELKNYTGGKSPTIRQLLNMTSGVPHGAMTYVTPAHPGEADIMKDRGIVVFAPGETFHSNFSIAVLDEVIEKASRTPFPALMRGSVFAPLGMTESSVGATVAPAARYGADDALLGPIYPLPRSSRQMQASLHDLLKYAAFQLGTPLAGSRAILSKASLDEMHNEVSGAPGAHMALGWASMDIGEGKRWLISSGNDMGVQSSLTLLPESGVGVVVLTNTSGYQADEIGVRIADAAAPGFLAKAMAAIGAFEGQSMPYAPSSEWLGEWSGIVKSADGDIATTIRFGNDGSVRVTFGDAPPVPLADPGVRHGLLTGSFEGVLSLEESARMPHRVEVGLQRKGETLEGFMLANFRNDNGKFEIPTYARLTRK